LFFTKILLRILVLIPKAAMMRNMYSVPAAIRFMVCNTLITTHHWLPALRVSFLDGYTPIIYLSSTPYPQLLLQDPLFHFGDWNMLKRKEILGMNVCTYLER